MSQFRGTVKGNRGEASRLGTKSSGLMVEANGWNKGIRVICNHEDNQDVFYVWETGGSNRNTVPELIMEIADDS